MTRKITTHDYLNILLMSLLGSQDLVDRWWTSPNKGFAGQCPKDVPEAQVRKYLEGFCYGQ